MTKGRSAELHAMWETLAHKVLAVVLVDEGAVFAVQDVVGARLHLWPESVVAIWRGILACVKERTPPTVEAVTLRSGCGAGFVQAIANQWTEEDSRRVIYNAEELQRLGQLHALRDLGRELQEVTDPAEIGAMIELAENRVNGLVLDSATKDNTATGIDEMAWARVKSFEGAGIPTGLRWFDEITGGLWHGMNCWIAAPYKAGKTTVMRNMVLSALETVHSVDVFCAEGSGAMFALDCQAMIGTRLLIEERHRWGPIDLRLSGLCILRGWNFGSLDEDERAAIEQAREIWRSYNVRVYDSADGIKDLVTLRHFVRRDRMNCNLDIAFADYSQLFGEGTTLFERQSATALAVQDIAAKEDVAFVMLTQKNEEAIRTPNSYSAGVKGGGDASAAADFLLVPMIDQEVRTQMRVALKFSRHTATGGHEHTINPASGLIVDKWVEHRPVPF